MSQPSSYLATLERHRKTFAILEEYQEVAEQLLELTRQCLKSGGKVIFMGNGGSAADSQHLAAEFMVRYKKERGPLASIALDLVIGLTTSGQSENINRALKAANELGAGTVALTGRDGGKVKDIAKLSIIINSDETARIQEAHMFIGHWLCEAMDEVVLSGGLD